MNFQHFLRSFIFELCLKILRFYTLDFLMIANFSNHERVRSSPPEAFLGKSVLKICRRFTVKHSCRSVISIKLQSNFIEIALRYGCSLVNLLHIFRTPFPKNTSDGLLLKGLNCLPLTSNAVTTKL